jgi:hypothetical protein
MKKVKVQLLISLFVILGAFVCVSSGQAYVVALQGVHGGPVPGSELIGRGIDTSAGIAATAAWATGGASLSWNIVAVTGGYQYSYVWTGSVKDLSHIILEVSSNTIASDFWGYTTNPESGDPKTYTATSDGKSNPNLPGPIYGLKFEPCSDSTSFSFSFISDRAPMWGNFYAKDGKDQNGTIDVTAWNTGFLQTGQSYYAAVPDTHTVVPIPPAIWLMGTGLLSLIGIRRRFRK